MNTACSDPWLPVRVERRPFTIVHTIQILPFPWKRASGLVSNLLYPPLITQLLIILNSQMVGVMRLEVFP